MILNYNEYVLLESSNKIDVLKTKYKDISNDVFDKLVEADPTNNKAYLNWILNTYNKSDNKKVFIEDLYKVKEYLIMFDKLKSQHKLEHTDINYYNDYKELFNDISKIGGTGNPTEDENYLLTDRYYINNNEAELFFEDNDYLIVIPHTLDASKFYAKNTHWCTQYPHNFEEYSSDGDLYIIIDKHLINTNNTNRRLQFHFDSDQFMDINDGDLLSDFKSKFLSIFKDVKDNFKLKFDKTYDFYKNKIAAIYNKTENKFGFIDRKGNILLPFKYGSFNKFTNNKNYTKVESNKKRGLININGEVICDCKYDYIGEFNDGLAIVQLKTKYGYINQEGKEICPIKYDYACDFENGTAIVKLNGKTRVINNKGLDITELYM